MMNPYAHLSTVRIKRILESEHNYESPADMIADIMHYCDAHNVPFETLLNMAQGYYDADLEEEKVLEDDGA